MFFSFRQEHQERLNSMRLFGGLHITTDYRKLETALLGLSESKPGSPVVLQKSMAFDMPDEIVSRINAVTEQITDQRQPAPFNDVFKPSSNTEGISGPSDDSGNILQQFDELRYLISLLEEEAIQQLMTENHQENNSVVAFTVSDPGLRTRFTQWGKQLRYHTLSDAALLAQKTGFNIIDAIHNKDVVENGQGRPLLSLPQWVFLNQDDRKRLLLDLGVTARWTLFPKADTETAWQQIQYHDIGPCGNLLNFLTYQISKGELNRDIGGRLSVQGRSIPELLHQWLELTRDLDHHSEKDSSLKTSISCYLSTLQQSGNIASWSLQDILCTAVHWLAEQIHRDFQRSFPDGDIPEIILTGAARQNGLLFNRLSALFHPHQIHLLSEYGFQEDTFDAMAVAMLGVFFVSRIPAALPALTGADRPSVSGRLTPGNNLSWKTLLQWNER